MITAVAATTKRRLFCGFSTSLKRASSRSNKTPSQKYNHIEETEEGYFEDLHERIARYKKELSKNRSLASFRSRELSTQITNISQSIAAVRAKRRICAELMDPNVLSNIPSNVSIEILSNGTGLLGPTCFIRTPLKTYLFNCPEGTQRIIPQMRLKSNNIHDVFITRGVWDNIGGISGILLGKDVTAPATRIHGAMNIKNFLECIRPFQDADFGSAKYPSQIEECPYSMGVYEDPGMKVTYIPLSPPLHAGTGNRKGVAIDIAYLIQLSKPAKRIDVNKLVALKIPKGPLIGKLKAGNIINLADGRVITPDQVYADEDLGASDLPNLLVAECNDEFCVDSLVTNSILQSYINGTQQLNYMLHFSKSRILRMPKFQSFIKQLGCSCIHIVINGEGPIIPHSEGVFQHQRRLAKLSTHIFPELAPIGWMGTLTQNSELAYIDNGLVYASPLQRFFMRPGGSDELLTLDFRDVPVTDETDDFQKSEKETREFEERLANLSYESEKRISSQPQEFPSISFLGTSSATPSKYRNVTGYLIETGPSSSFLVDVGEGTLGQMRVLFGEKFNQLLSGINVVFITHAHQDHIGGIFSIIERRKEAFELLGTPYRKIVLVCNHNVSKPLKTYTQTFSNIEDYFVEINLSTVVSSSPKRDLPLIPVQDIAPLMPKDLYDPLDWGIEGMKAVQVHHTRMANGFVFICKGKKMVFSGDTKPCDLLVDEGLNADLLVHECTFEDGFERDAERKKHSTMGQAVQIATRMKANTTILTHFSARYTKVPPLPAYLDEIGNIGVAMDNMRARYDHWSLIPRLVPLYRYVFKEELFQLSLRKDQRDMRQQLHKQEDGELPKLASSVVKRTASNNVKTDGNLKRSRPSIH